MNKFHLPAAVLAACLFVVTGCRREDLREMKISLPGVVTAADRAAVLRAVDGLTGIDKKTMVFDEAKKELRMFYDSMQIRRKNVEIAIAEAGYDANEVPAVPRSAK